MIWWFRGVARGQGVCHDATGVRGSAETARGSVRF